MRRLFLTVLGLSWLALVGGCQSANPGCGQGCNSGGTGGRGARCSTAHGVCDCYVDEYCTNRSPWIRNIAPVALGAPVEAIPAPPTPVAPKTSL